VQLDGDSAAARRRDRLATGLAFALPLGLYVLTATRTVQGGDAGEFILVAVRGGVPHPPGYPLYTLLARLAAALPLGPPALRVALLSAVCGAATVALLQRLLTRLTGSLLAGLAAALAFAVAPIQWQLAGLPEVFSLGALLAVAALFAAWQLGTATGRARAPAVALGLAFGLGLANHHTIVLCAPVALWALAARARRAGGRALAAACGWAALGALLGLACYLYLPLAARGASPETWVWGEPASARGLLRHVLRAEYGTFKLGLYRHAARPLHNLGAFAATLPRAFFYVYFAAALIGLWAGLRRARGFALGLLASFLLAGGAFLAVFNLPASAVARAVAARFYLLPTVLLTPFAAFGLAAIGPRLSPLGRRLLLLAPLPLAAVASFGGANWRGDPTIERYLAAAVQELAPQAVILGHGDLEGFGFDYVREVLRLRPDVRYVDVELIRLPWYHARVQRALPGVRVPYDARHTPLLPLVDAVRQHHPTYVTASLAPLLGRVSLYPEGLLARVAPDGAPPPPPDELEAAATRALRALGNLPDAPADPWSAYLRGAAAQPWEILGGAFAARGEGARAGACLSRARALRGR
jgi:hypothetical protein